jgi:hypothetical protein
VSLGPLLRRQLLACLEAASRILRCHRSSKQNNGRTEALPLSFGAELLLHLLRGAFSLFAFHAHGFELALFGFVAS